MHPHGTRKSNANKHPGIVDIDTHRKKRRSHQEMNEAHLEKEASVKALEATNAELLKTVAKLQAESRKLEDESTGPSALPATKPAPKDKVKRGKTTASKTRPGISLLPAGKGPPAAAQAVNAPPKNAKSKPRRADVEKLIVESEDVVNGEGKRKRKSSTDSASRTDSTVNSVSTNKKSKPLHPSGLLTSYKSQPSSKTASTTTTPNSTTEAPDDSIKYGGYIASDSESEVEFAEASETGDRKTSQTTVKIEINNDVLAPTIQGAPNLKASKKYTVKDIYALLPSHCHYVFAELYVPEVMYFFGNRICPWNWTGVNWTDTFGLIMAATLPTGVEVPPTDPQSAVAQVTMQRIAEWKSGMGKHSIEVVAKKVRDEGFTEDETEEFIDQQLSRGLPFLSLYTKYDVATKKIVREGKFLGPLLLATFAYHLGRVGKSADEFRDTPDAALALACVALERALEKHRTGKLDVLRDRTGATADAFSYKLWGLKTKQYTKSIANLMESDWTAIFSGAEAYLVPDNTLGNSNNETTSIDGDDDERACI